MRLGNVFWTVGISCLYFSFLQLFWGNPQGNLLFDGIKGVLIQFLPVIGYTVYMLIEGKNHAVYWEKIRTFKVHAVVVAVELFAGLVMEKALDTVLIYMAAYLFFSVIALNLYRYGKALDGAGKWLFVSHLGVYALFCAACAGVISFVGKSGGKILELILTPFAYLLAGLVSLGTFVTPLLRNGAEKMVQEETVTEESAEQMQQAQQLAQITEDAAGTTWLDVVFKVLPVILLILILVYAVYQIYRWYKERYIYREDEVNTVNTYEKTDRKGFGRIKLFKTNREKVCKEYAKYMRSVRAQGYRIGKSSTSLDICEEAQMRLGHDAVENERIREIYMKARYSAEPISDEDVREIRQLI